MTLTDILIVYFAMGSPFAVYRFVDRQGPLSSARLKNALVAWPFWPIEASRYIFATVRKRAGKKRRSRLAELTAAKHDAVREWTDGVTKEILGSCRNGNVIANKLVLDRYIGLSLAVNSCEDAFEEVELFRIAGRNDTKTAAACLRRRNAARLIRHHSEARADLVALAKQAAFGPERGIVKGILRVAELVEDAVAVAEINGLIQDEREFRVKNVWKRAQEFSEM